MSEQGLLLLKVWTDGTDTVIAEDIRDVQRVMEHHAASWESEDDDWRVVANDKVIRIRVESNDETPDRVVIKNAAEWIAEKGRGFLCSTEY